MSHRHSPDELLDQAVAAVSEAGTISAAARLLGIPRTTLKCRLDAAARRDAQASRDPGEQFVVEQADDAGTIKSTSETRKTPEDAFAASGLDPAVWEIARSTVRYWDAIKVERDENGKRRNRTVTLYGVTVIVRRRIRQRVMDALDLVLEDIRSHAPRYPKPPKRSRRRRKLLLEWSPQDVHFGKLAWAAETGEDFDLDIARRVFLDAAKDTLARVDHDEIAQIVIPIGNDFFNIDGWHGQTVNGTPQDNDGRWPKIFRTGLSAVVEAVDMFAAVAPVKIMWVPGNHDRTTSYHLCETLAAWYRNTDRVDVDVSPAPRKYHRHGVCLLGFTHGNEEKHASLPTIMAQEMPHEWSQTTDREWHLGHWHQRRATVYSPVATYDGVTVRVLPSLTARDAWHFLRGYIGGRRSCEAYLWHADDGYQGHIAVHAKEAA